MNKAIDGFCSLLNVLMVVALATMVALVFGNVVLRYGFNTGITVSEEVSRWLFLWLTFMGAVVALKEHGHLGTDMLVSRLSPRGKKAVLLVAQLAMIYVTWLLLKGSWVQMLINWEVEAPVTGLSVAIFYASGVFFGVAGLVILLRDFLRAVTGRLSDAELVMVHSAEEIDPRQAEAPAAGPRADGPRRR